MSQAPKHHHDAPHEGHAEGPIKTPKQLAVAVFLAFVLPVAIIVLLVTFVNSAAKPAEGSTAFTPEATAARIMPVAMVQLKVKSAVAGAASGEEVYKGQCAACHTAGALGAPKFGEAGAWSARLGQGLDTLTAHAVNGYNSMPKQGGGDYSEVEIKRAVAYMGNAAGGKFVAPAVVAAAEAPAP